jgi:hypothetical protein
MKNILSSVSFSKSNLKEERALLVHSFSHGGRNVWLHHFYASGEAANHGGRAKKKKAAHPPAAGSREREERKSWWQDMSFKGSLQWPVSSN